MDDHDFNHLFRGLLMKFGFAWLVAFVFTIVVNLALLAGAVWVVVWVLRATGVLSA